MASEQKVKRHVFNFDPKNNGGESLTLTTDFFSNGDPGETGVFLNQELTLQSYGNSATFNLSGIVLTPEILRKLANEMEKAKMEAVFEIEKKQKQPA